MTNKAVLMRRLRARRYAAGLRADGRDRKRPVAMLPQSCNRAALSPQESAWREFRDRLNIEVPELLNGLRFPKEAA